jgi:hypothetical protein
MRFSASYVPAPTFAWRRTFAWYPVKTIEAVWVWLEWVEKNDWRSPEITADKMRNCSTPFRPRRLIRG